ncbi:unnamed protein product [Peniophora sp. CBMAI 1063]|nr:unnamed protein product [Peniophora sp. CBMAI 1063]
MSPNLVPVYPIDSIETDYISSKVVDTDPVGHLPVGHLPANTSVAMASKDVCELEAEWWSNERDLERLRDQSDLAWRDADSVCDLVGAIYGWISKLEVTITT